MFDFDQYQHTCAKLLELTKKGRGGIYIGDYNVLGTNVFGQQMIVDSRHAYSLKTLYVPPAVETSVLALMLHLIKRGMVCVDVGAGCGSYTLLAAAVSGPHGKVYSFEPIPECFSLLEENVAMNNIETVVCINCPISDTAKIIKQHYFDGHYQFFFFDDTKQVERQIEQESLTLDHYFESKETSIDFVKINVEKDLPFIVKGMSDLILFNPHIKILCRFNKEKISQNYSPEQFLDELQTLQFEFLLLPSLDKIEKEELLDYSTTKHLLLTRKQ